MKINRPVKHGWNGRTAVTLEASSGVARCGRPPRAPGLRGAKTPEKIKCVRYIVRKSGRRRSLLPRAPNFLATPLGARGRTRVGKLRTLNV
jgi:hypothetical protein